MNKILKYGIIAISSVILILVVIAIFVTNGSNSKLDKTYKVEVDKLSVPTDKKAIENGKHLTETKGCQECHGKDLSGSLVVNDKMFGKIYAPNLRAEEDAEEGQSKADVKTEVFIEAIRYGINHETRKSLLLMPAGSFYFLSDDDLGSILAYLNTLSLINKENQDNYLGPIGRLLLFRGEVTLPAEIVSKNGPRFTKPKPANSAAYGKYLVYTSNCRYCHKENLSGGFIADAPPKTPSSPNLTMGGEFKEWSLKDFMGFIRKGEDDTGKKLNDFMPWKYFKNMTDDELGAIYKYLGSVPPVVTKEDE